MDQTDEILETMQKEMPYLKREYGVTSLRLFGSQARGEGDKKSDVDLLVEFDEDHQNFFNRSRMEQYLEEVLRRPVESGTHVRPEIREDIEKDLIDVG